MPDFRPLTRRGGLNPLPVLMFGLVASAVMLAGSGVLTNRVERQRIVNVEQALVAAGYKGPVTVTPARGDSCWRARAGFYWSSVEAHGFACAGPGDEVDLTSGRWGTGVVRTSTASPLAAVLQH